MSYYNGKKNTRANTSTIDVTLHQLNVGHVMKTFEHLNVINIKESNAFYICT